MIDPQLQGIRWLRRHEEVATEASGRSLVVLQMGEVRPPNPPRYDDRILPVLNLCRFDGYGVR